MATSAQVGKLKQRNSEIIFDVASKLLGQWEEFGHELGFQEHQLLSVKSITETDDPATNTKLLLTRWMEIVENHTRNYIPLLLIAFRNIERNDLVNELSVQTGTAVPDKEYLKTFDINDLIEHLRRTEFLDISKLIESDDCQRSKKKGSQKRKVVNYFMNCKNVLIGDHGMISISKEAKSGLHDPEVGRDERSAIVLNLLKSVLIPVNNGELKEMKIQKLESSFLKIVGTEKGKPISFQSMTKIPLLEFIKNYEGEHFHVEKRKGQWYVRLHRKTDLWQSTYKSQFSPRKLEKLTQIQEFDKPVKEDNMDTVQTTEKGLVPSDIDRPLVDQNEDKWSTVCKAKRNSPQVSLPITETGDRRSYANVAATYLPIFSRDKDSINTKQKCKSDVDTCNAFELNPVAKGKEMKTKLQNLPKISHDANDFFTFVQNFTKGHFVLVTGKVPYHKNIESFAFVPWLAVFDFDIYSRKNGLLSMLENSVKVSKGIHVCSWKDDPRISDQVLQWTLLRGSVQEAESRTPELFNEWYQNVSKYLETHLRALGRYIEIYSVLKIILLWPHDLSEIPFIYRTLSKMEDFIDPPPKVVVIQQNGLEDLQSNTIYSMLNPDFTLISSLGNLSSYLHSIGKMNKKKKISYQLPTLDETNIPNIDEPIAASLRDELDILYLESPFTASNIALEQLQEAADHFFKGGTLPWYIYYECGVGHFDAERDICENITSKIRTKYIAQFRSGVLTLYHAPGSGGTTLAQRVLWNLRNKTPCAQIKLFLGSNLTDLAHKIEMLFEKTKLPIVLLIDGDDQNRVKHLFRQLGHTTIIFLRVIRCPVQINESSLKENEFWLRGTVSANEAKNLYLRFHPHCDTEDKKSELQKIVNDVKEQNMSHCVYEFGLTTFVHEYTGLDNFVKGYLFSDVDHQHSKDLQLLQPFQKIAGYLSLIYFYGQTSMPCQFFAKILGKPINYEVTVSDFPDQISNLIVPCTNESRKNYIRICHYEVAKVILELLLTLDNPNITRINRTDLSTQAKLNLYKFSAMFIEEAKKRKGKQHHSSGCISGVLARAYIYRDYQDVSEGEWQGRKKPTLSRLLADIDQRSPYTWRVKTMELLAKSFPENPNFHAHLGRIYAICRPDEEKKAEECFLKALSLCNIDENVHIDEGNRQTLLHIYHMYGMFYLGRISRYTGKSFGDTPTVKTNKENFEERIKCLLNLSEMACEYFKKGQGVAVLGTEEAYGYTGEISVKLQVCNFIYQHSRMPNLSDFTGDTTDLEMVCFVRDSITDIPELFMQCYNAVEPEDLGRNFHMNIHWYNELFKDQTTLLKEPHISDDIPTRRLKAAIIKLQYGKEQNLGTMSNIRSEKDIKEIIRIFERNFQEIESSKEIINRRALDLEYKEWIHAIRLEKFKGHYTLENVLVFVRQWHDALKSPTSKFYLFVILSIMGFGCSDGMINLELLLEARDLKDQLRKLSHHIPRPRQPKEWLGHGEGIKRLVPGNELLRLNDFQVVTGEPRLLVMKGTICRPNNTKQSGFIELDLGDNYFAVKVFFVPARTKEMLFGQIFSGERVEFVLGFTNSNGYEAYNVTLLKKYPCSSCGSNNEITSFDYYVDCFKCKSKVQKFNDFDETCSL